jgi:hypothetical protein
MFMQCRGVGVSPGDPGRASLRSAGQGFEEAAATLAELLDEAPTLLLDERAARVIARQAGVMTVRAVRRTMPSAG